MSDATVRRMPPARLHDLSLVQRLARLQEGGQITAADALALRSGALLSAPQADRMIENVIGVFGLPLALGLGFVVDGAPYAVPMVVEEPSIVAAISSAAKLVARCGGFVSTAAESLLIGQVQLVDVPDVAAAIARLAGAERALLAECAALQPSMVARGGGPRGLEVRASQDAPHTLVVHLLVDTCDAMGANAVNALCEAMAPRLAELSCGRPGLRILSNLTDRALVQARCTLSLEALGSVGRDGIAVRDGIVAAGRMAETDVYRAVTHNKGVMNGIDAVAVATGNDWRAIAAAAHAWAGRAAGYAPLTRWRVGAGGALVGDIELPLKVGTAGGNFAANPGVALAQRILGAGSARTLARVMAAVGLAQNFAALRALSGEGISRGHMRLHARSVTASAGAPPHLFDAALARLLAGGDIKLHRAQAIVAELRAESKTTAVDAGAGAATNEAAPPAPARAATGAREGHGAGWGKLIVCGEHAVVYGAHALAVPLRRATRVHVHAAGRPGIHLCVPAWGIDAPLPRDEARPSSLHASLWLMLRRMGLADDALHIAVDADVPRAMGLGSSAALAVATVRALAAYRGLSLPEHEVIELAFEAEKVAHGTPSGVDNALAAVGRPLLFARGPEGPILTPQRVRQPLHWVVGLTHEESLTATTVAAVREAHLRAPAFYGRLFAQMDELACSAARAMADGDRVQLGQLMDLNHGLLHALRISTAQLEACIHIARAHGALGAKLTGGGGGGSMLALCADAAGQAEVVAALQRAGYAALAAETPATPLTPSPGDSHA